LGEYEVTTKGFYGSNPEELLGRMVSDGKSVRVVEYFAVAQGPRPSWWNEAPASMATYVWNVAFLARCVKEKVELPYYRLPYRGRGSGGKPLYKLERFAFDLLPHARSTGLVIVDRSEEYAAVKEPSSLQTARTALCGLYQRWLERSGARPKRPDCRVEISPLFALDENELKQKLPPHFTYDDGLVLV
jgi:hypothetical protein